MIILTNNVISSSTVYLSIQFETFLLATLSKFLNVHFDLVRIKKKIRVITVELGSPCIYNHEIGSIRRKTLRTREKGPPS